MIFRLETPNIYFDFILCRFPFLYTFIRCHSFLFAFHCVFFCSVFSRRYFTSNLLDILCKRSAAVTHFQIIADIIPFSSARLLSYMYLIDSLHYSRQVFILFCGIFNSDISMGNWKYLHLLRLYMVHLMLYRFRDKNALPKPFSWSKFHLSWMQNLIFFPPKLFFYWKKSNQCSQMYFLRLPQAPKETQKNEEKAFCLRLCLNILYENKKYRQKNSFEDKNIIVEILWPKFSNCLWYFDDEKKRGKKATYSLIILTLFDW